jgi:hypothetical protein
MDVTAEVTPHHLLLTDESALSYDPIYKVNPPLRTQRDVEALFVKVLPMERSISSQPITPLIQRRRKSVNGKKLLLECWG